MSMEVILNGEKRQLESQSVAELVAALNLSEKAIAVAVNRSIIARGQWNEHQLQERDQIDVVHAIGGG